MSPPVDKAEQISNLKAAREEGLISYQDEVREYRTLATNDEAQIAIEQIQEEDTETPPPARAQPQQQQQGRSGVRLPRPVNRQQPPQE